MATIDLSDYKALYLTTAYEYVGTMRASLLLLKETSSDKEALERMYRSAHSLKSQSALMGYKNTASVSEFIEHTMRNCKDAKKKITKKILDDLEQAIQTLEKAVNSIELLNKEPSLQEAVAN